jgi:hypothetical protein
MSTGIAADQIPAELKSRPRWVGWRYGEPRNGGKRPKIPINIRTGKPADVTNPADWCDFETAFANVGNYDGLGFVLNGDGICAIDLDNCFDSNNELEPWAGEIFDSIDSYWEISPSGQGLRCFLKGQLPKAGCRKGGIELYSDKRFVTFTGLVIGDDGTDVADCSAELLNLCNNLCSNSAEHSGANSTDEAVENTDDLNTDLNTGVGAGNNPAENTPLADEQVISRLRAAENHKKFETLFDRGDWQSLGYRSQSEADLALCMQLTFYTSDAGQIDRLFRQSALYREKWERADYREQTIRKAIASQEVQYHPPERNSQTAIPPSASSTPLKDGPVLVRLSDVRPEKIKWVWRGRLAAGKLSLPIGDPGVGKSTVVIDIVCRITRGSDWPDGGTAPLGNVIVLASEDSLADTVRPRVDSHNGDASRIHVLKAVRSGNVERPFSLDKDLSQLEVAIRTIGNVRVIVVDALSDYLGSTNTWKDTEIRSVLVPVKDLAERYGIAVIGIVHLSKDGERKAIYRALGSIGFVALARSVFAFGTDKNDPDRRIMACVKSNLGPMPPSLAFTIVEQNGIGVVEWEAEPVDIDADTLLSSAKIGRPSQKRDRAKDFLECILADGEVPAETVREAAEEQGISEKTLQRAKDALGVESRKEGQPGQHGQWFWSLPA